MWWHTVTHGRGSEEGNWRKEWVASTLHTISEHGVSSITTADAAHLGLPAVDWTDATHGADLNGLVRFGRKTKCGFCACAVTFQTQSNSFSKLVTFANGLNLDTFFSKCASLLYRQIRYLCNSSRVSAFEMVISLQIYVPVILRYPKTLTLHITRNEIVCISYGPVFAVTDYIRLFSSLSYDRSKASSPHRAI